jgi:DnaJ-class molecular chaperone
MRDPYSVLGVKRDAPADEIKAAWRSKAKSIHPDQNRDDPNASQRFAEVGQAYDVLKDPKKRDRYDQARKVAAQKHREQTIMQQREAAREAAERAKAAEKLMEELAKAEARKPQGATSGKPADATAPEAPEDMLERIFGAQARQQQAKTSASDSSNSGTTGTSGNGTTSEEAQAYSETDGSGDKTPAAIAAAGSFITSLFKRLTGTSQVIEKAPDITAEATVTVSDFLEKKSVSLTLSDEREVRFQIEPGMTDGHIVRLKGQGLKIPGMQRGDLTITLLAARSDNFRINGYDIHTPLSLSLQDAVLGCETTLQAPEGEISVTVPAWSGSDQTIRIPGKGLYDDKGERGDLVMEIRIVLLEKPDEKVTDLMRHMRQGLYL